MYLRIATNVALEILQRNSPHADIRLQSYFSHDSNFSVIGTSDRNIIKLTGKEKGKDTEIKLTMYGSGSDSEIELQSTASTETELHEVIQAWSRDVYWWQSRLSFFRLKCGSEYVVNNEFTDHDGQRFHRGFSFLCTGSNHFAKEEGYTINFEGGLIRLQGEMQNEVINNFYVYFSKK